MYVCSLNSFMKSILHIIQAKGPYFFLLEDVLNSHDLCGHTMNQEFS